MTSSIQRPTSSSSSPSFVASGAALVIALSACTQSSTSTASGNAQRSSASTPLTVSVTTNVYPAPKRIVAFGDVHGDLDVTRRALRLAGAIDAQDAWIGGDLIVVQVGDQLDRGDDDRAILDLFDELPEKAKAAGGAFIPLNGNHELLNATLDFRYVTPGSFSSFAELTSNNAAVRALPEEQRGRGAAFLPGGIYAKKLAKRPFYAIVGDSVFVHGGITTKHLRYGLDKADKETKDWLDGRAPNPPTVVVAQDGAVWERRYSQQTGPDDCKELERVLQALDKKRLVMGHTVQNPDISFACDDRAVRTDIGMSKGVRSGRVQVLEIVGEVLTVLKE